MGSWPGCTIRGRCPGPSPSCSGRAPGLCWHPPAPAVAGQRKDQAALSAVEKQRFVDALDALNLPDQTGVSAAELGQLLNLLSTTDITQLDVTLGVTRLSLRRPATAPRAPDLADNGVPPPVEREPASLAIASPLVGIFRPSVSVGDSVSPGQPIGAIEALGMPNTVDAPQGGTVEDLLVLPGSPVEYGQPLLILRRPPLPLSK